MAHPTPPDRPVTKATLRAWTLKLQGWRRPDEFRRVVAAIRRVMDTHALDQPGSSYREAHIALSCADRAKADWVRLGADPPDFELLIGRRALLCEAVEIQAPQRRRGEELRAERQLTAEDRAVPQLVDVDSEEWLNTEVALTQVRHEIEKKAARQPPYPEDYILCVYLNLGFLDQPTDFAAGLADAVGPATAAFAEVWMLMSSGELKIFRRWQAGPGGSA